MAGARQDRQERQTLLVVFVLFRRSQFLLQPNEQGWAEAKRNSQRHGEHTPNRQITVQKSRNAIHKIERLALPPADQM